MPDVSQSGLSSDSHPQSPAKGDYKFDYYNSDKDYQFNNLFFDINGSTNDKENSLQK